MNLYFLFILSRYFFNEKRILLQQLYNIPKYLNPNISVQNQNLTTISSFEIQSFIEKIKEQKIIDEINWDSGEIEWEL
jgi:hypothetical protein